jgi:hypothetical protein
MSYKINWDDNFLPLYGDPITIPAGTVLWRGFDPAFPPVSDRPAYYGSQKFAKGYANKYKMDVFPFITTRILKLLDIRFMKVLLTQLFEHNSNTTDKPIISATTIAFGLCSLQHQIKLFNDRYRAIYTSSNKAYDNLKLGIKKLETFVNLESIVEQPGVRIAETSNDAIVMGFLKELFDDHYDGYISPNILTPFHVEKQNFILNSELVVFNPIHSGIRLLKYIPSDLQTLTINGCILQNGYGYRTIDTRTMKTSFYVQSGGGDSTVPEVCDDYNSFYDKNHKGIVSLYNDGAKCGRKWNRKILSAIAPGPMVDPTIFNHQDLVVEKN